ncbi:hypothetical protein C8J57DRAFT_1517189 [Mycena rebaudengoi]|nr:hypothetical protein C8J57DRAFT_1517189 [Mycena rebaudengoi]
MPSDGDPQGAGRLQMMRRGGPKPLALHILVALSSLRTAFAPCRCILESAVGISDSRDTTTNALELRRLRALNIAGSEFFSLVDSLSPTLLLRHASRRRRYRVQDADHSDTALHHDVPHPVPLMRSSTQPRESDRAWDARDDRARLNDRVYTLAPDRYTLEPALNPDTDDIPLRDTEDVGYTSSTRHGTDAYGSCLGRWCTAEHWGAGRMLVASFLIHRQRGTRRILFTRHPTVAPGDRAQDPTILTPPHWMSPFHVAPFFPLLYLGGRVMMAPTANTRYTAPSSRPLACACAIHPYGCGASVSIAVSKAYLESSHPRCRFRARRSCAVGGWAEVDDAALLTAPQLLSHPSDDADDVPLGA